MNGTYSPFDMAFLMWICEEPNGLEDCGVTRLLDGGENGTGHAEIIGGVIRKWGVFGWGVIFMGECGLVILRGVRGRRLGGAVGERGGLGLGG